MRLLAHSGVVLVALLSAAEAQRFRRGDAAHSRNTEKLRRVFAPASHAASRSTVTVCKDGARVALGTIVTADGLVLTKASEIVEGEVAVRLAKAGDLLPARRVGVDHPNDLALLRIDKKDLRPAVFAVANKTRQASFVVTAAPFGGAAATVPIAYGVMSVARHARRATYLGIRTGGGDAKITDVVEGSAAAAAGLQPGDVIVAVDGERLRTRMALSFAIKKKRPGDELKLGVQRDGERLDLVAKLGITEDRHGPVSDQEKRKLWGPLSRVRLGFDEVIQHDSVIRPQDCGGPLCNLDGEIVAINIARVGRFESVALTAKVVVQALHRLRAGANLTKPKK